MRTEVGNINSGAPGGFQNYRFLRDGDFNGIDD
jgi:hypothetical protein